MTNTQKSGASLFNFLMACAALLIILLPVGIANAFFGYVMGDSPCTLCWGQRIAMMFIGVAAFFIVRYGFKGRYAGSILIFAASGLFESFRHTANHAARDLDQGFGLQVFGLHTYFWAEVVFWAVVVLLGVMFFFASRASLKAADETEGKPWFDLSKFSFGAMAVSAVVLLSNLIQAAVSTGLPPNYGQGDPIRFSWNSDTIIHTPDGMKNHFKKISFLGVRDVKAPDYAFAGNAEALGIKFDHAAANAPLEVTDKLGVAGETAIGIKAPLNSISLINGEYVVSSKWDVFFLDKDLKTVDSFEFDPLYSATIDPAVGIIPWKGDKYVLMGSNKSLLKFEKSVTDKPNDQLVGRYSDFVKGADHFFAIGRGRVSTVRAKFNHVLSFSSDNAKYGYLVTVPNNLNKKKFVVTKILLSDLDTAAEFTPSAKLKEGRTLGDLYVTGTAYADGSLFAISKNYNVIVEIDLATESVKRVFSVPETVTDPRGLIITEGGFQTLDHNKIVTLK